MNTLLMTVCSCIKHKNTKECVKHNLLLRNHWNPQILCNKTKGAKEARKTARGKCGKHRSSSVRPWRFPSLLSRDRGANFPIPSWSRLGCAQSYLLLRSILSPCSFLPVNPHDVLDHQSIRMFWIISFSNICLCLQLCDMHGAECGPAAAFQFASVLIFDLFLDFVLCDIGHFIITQSSLR